MDFVQILNNQQREKIDLNDDSLFFEKPRFVYHLDSGFRNRLTDLYMQRISCCSVVLDLMSSWVSHLPNNVHFNYVIGHGMNAKELEANTRLDQYWVQDLNNNQSIPLEDESIDATLIVAGWQYLQQPEAVASELLRITRPNGIIIVAFSNRLFVTKATKIWTDSLDKERLNYVAQVLIANGWQNTEYYGEKNISDELAGVPAKKGDPFFAIVASKNMVDYIKFG